MSAYVVGPYGFLMTSTFFVLCAGLLAVGFGLMQTLPRTGLTNVALALTLIASAGFFIAGIFPTDWPPPMRTRSSQLHGLGGMLAFPAVTVASVLFSLKFRNHGYWTTVSAAALTLSTGIIVAFALFQGLIDDQAPDFVGLAQRAFFALLFAWMIVVGRHLARAPRAVLNVVVIAGLLGAAQPVWAQATIPVYSGVAPGSERWTLPETVVTLSEPIPLGAVITNVSQPTLTVFRPDLSTRTNTAVIVAPGGAFHFLTMEEGIRIAEWFRSRGITALVLKYRVLQTTQEHMDPKRLLAETVKQTNEETAPVFPLAVADARAALAFVRAHAADYGVLPNRVGIIGFSAGAQLAVHLALHSAEGQGPDFIASLYSGMNDLMRPLSVPNWAPPAFFAVASDDQLGFAPVSADLYVAWLAAVRPVELHAYAQGGHGFTMRARGLPVDSWPQRLEDWLRSGGWLK
jgi:dienelactone hydrolase